MEGKEEKDIGELLQDSDNKELKQELSIMFKDLFSDFLNQIEIAIPFNKGDNTENEKRFGILRSRVLRAGNDKIRLLDILLDNYFIKRVVRTEKVIIDFNKDTVNVIFNGKTKGGNDNG